MWNIFAGSHTKHCWRCSYPTCTNFLTAVREGIFTILTFGPWGWTFQKMKCPPSFFLNFFWWNKDHDKKTNGPTHFSPCTWRILASLMRKYFKIKSLCLLIHIKALGSNVRGRQVLKWNSTSKLFVSQWNTLPYLKGSSGPCPSALWALPYT
jgi:hypothetical protein